MKLASEALLRDVLQRMHKAVQAGGPGSGRHPGDGSGTQIKRIVPGHYAGTHLGHDVEIYRVVKHSYPVLVHKSSHEVLHRKDTGWNLKVNGKLRADWLPSRKAAIQHLKTYVTQPKI